MRFQMRRKGGFASGPESMRGDSVPVRGLPRHRDTGAKRRGRRGPRSDAGETPARSPRKWVSEAILLDDETARPGVDSAGAPPGTNAPTQASHREGSDLESLIRNQWELHDVKKMQRLKAAAVGVVVLVLFTVILILVGSVSSRLSPSGLSSDYQALVAGGITLAATFVIAGKVRQMDREKRGWSFSALQDSRLDWDELLALARAFLSERNFVFAERSHRTITLFITYFDLAGTDFSMRLWFSRLLKPPAVEIGFGPETPANRGALRDLRAAMSETFARRFGTPT